MVSRRIRFGPGGQALLLGRDRTQLFRLFRASSAGLGRGGGAGATHGRLDSFRAQRGAALWWPGHVGIYAGNGWVVEALDARHGVVRRAAANPYRAFRPEI